MNTYDSIHHLIADPILCAVAPEVARGEAFAIHWTVQTIQGQTIVDDTVSPMKDGAQALLDLGLCSDDTQTVILSIGERSAYTTSAPVSVAEAVAELEPESADELVPEEAEVAESEPEEAAIGLA